MADGTDTNYDPITIALHWTTALLVVVLWTIGQTADWIPRGPVRGSYWSVHVALGFILVAVLIGRIAWRIGKGRRLSRAESGVLGLLAEAMHYALYLLLLVVVSLGMAAAFVRGFSLFGLVNLPQIGAPDLRRPSLQWHELAANLLLAFAAAHALAALGHHYVRRDGVLRRMFFSGRASVPLDGREV
jgi:cytochrome b561